jgi:hypothetical protein
VICLVIQHVQLQVLRVHQDWFATRIMTVLELTSIHAFAQSIVSNDTHRIKWFDMKLTNRFKVDFILPGMLVTHALQKWFLVSVVTVSIFLSFNSIPRQQLRSFIVLKWDMISCVKIVIGVVVVRVF